MSLIDPDKVKQLLAEFNEKEAVTKAEIQEVERQILELEGRIDESKQLLVSLAEDKEVVMGMKAEYGSPDWANLALKVGAELASRGGKRGESFLTGLKPVKKKAVPAQASASTASAPAQAASPAPAKPKTSQSKLAAIVNRDMEEKKKAQAETVPPTQVAKAAQAKSTPPVDDSLASALVQAIGSEPAPSSESGGDDNPSLFLFSHPKENKDVDLWSLTPSVSWADLGDEIPAEAESEVKPKAQEIENASIAQDIAASTAPESASSPAPAPAPMPAPGPSPNPDADVSPQAQTPLPPQAHEPMPESGPTPFLDDDEFETSEMAAESAPQAAAPVPAVLPPADLIAAASPSGIDDEKKDEPKSEAEEDVKKINDALRGLFS